MFFIVMYNESDLEKRSSGKLWKLFSVKFVRLSTFQILSFPSLCFVFIRDSISVFLFQEWYLQFCYNYFPESNAYNCTDFEKTLKWKAMKNYFLIFNRICSLVNFPNNFIFITLFYIHWWLNKRVPFPGMIAAILL